MKNVLELRNVCKEYKMGTVSVNALCNVNLDVKASEFISIMGPSGSGKSTMLNMIGLLDRPTKGSVFIEGRNTSDMSDDEMAKIRGKKIGFVFQTFNLIPRLTALENVTLPMWFQGVNKDERTQRANELLGMVGLEKRKSHRPTELSGGERQRVAIARALANEPEIILADEPTGNLDTKSGEEVLKVLLNLNRKYKRTLIVITHDGYIAHKAKKIIKIRDGKIIGD
jgi:putative ABC transport system ATP-binding protein